VFVLDASAALAWCFQDERTATGLLLLERCDEEEFFVPALWPLECANVLRTAERRGRLEAPQVDESLELLKELSPRVDRDMDGDIAATLLGLARAYEITVYDASYLELALRLNLPLATLDTRLMRAATDAGVTLIAT